MRLALFLIASLAFSAITSAQNYVPGEAIKGDYATFAKPFLSNYCTDCHSGTDPEGNLALDELRPIDETNIDLWRSVWAQVKLKEMPPKDTDQPETIARLKFSDWIVGELSSALKDQRRFPRSSRSKQSKLCRPRSPFWHAPKRDQTKTDIVSRTHLASDSTRTHHAPQ